MDIRKVRTVIAIILVLLLALWAIGTAVGEGSTVYLPTVYKNYNGTPYATVQGQEGAPYCPTATIPPIVVTAVYVTPDPECVPPYQTSTPTPTMEAYP